MIALLRKRIGGRANESGIAMIMVISVGAVMTLLIVAAVALSLNTFKRSATDDNWSAALAAAYAGIEEYQSRLSEEPGYVKYGNPASKFSNPTGSASPKVQLPPAAKTNPAFGLGPTGTWATVPGSIDDTAQFRYEVDNINYANTGTIRVRATGRVGGQIRTLVADLRQKGFIDFLYFTDFEMQDPVISKDTNCQTARYMWDGAGRNSTCVIHFASSDTIGGPVHSNDTLVICTGTRFKGIVTTGRPTGGYTKPGGCSDATFDLGPPIYSPALPMPATNTQIQKETRSDLTGGDVPRPGCLYTGPTEITFIGGGQMVVKSPWTKFVNIEGDPVTAGSNALSAQCGTIAALKSTAGATVPVPNNNVVYVQNIPLTGINSATDAETITSGTTSTKRCRSVAGTTLQSAATSAAPTGYSQNVVGYPRNTEVPLVVGTAADASYGCRNGDVFISGTLTGGALTVAAQNYVYVTDDVKYGSSETDMLGLIGQNAVWVYNPMTSGEVPLLGVNRRIDAAILSVAHTFIVQNYNKGANSRGMLTVNGAISQKFRGPVATTGGTGYGKNYVYDARFRYMAPPKFLSPVTTTYGVNVWVEVAPAMRADGSYR